MDVPELRIIDEQLWNQVSSRLNRIAQSPAAIAIRKSAFWKERRPKHVLTGLAFCGCCGHRLVAAGRDYLRCARADRNGRCSNTRGIRRGVLEATILNALQHNLMAPELVAEFTLAFNEELNKGRAEAEIERQASHRRLAEVQKQLEGLITAISEGLRAPGLQQRLDSLEAEKAKLEQQFLLPEPSPVRFHPNLSEVYRRRIEKLHEALKNEETRTPALELISSLVEKIVVKPKVGGGFVIELIGEIAKMVEIALENDHVQTKRRTALNEVERRSVKVVAGARNPRQLTISCEI